MPPGARKVELAARVLVAAMVKGDREVAQEYGVSRRSIQRWRSIITKDPEGELATSVAKKKEAVEGDWAAKIPTAIESCLDFIEKAAREGDPKDPDLLRSVAGALKMVSEVQISKVLMDARLSKQNRKPGKKAR
jgi:hypothetical protein